MQVIPAIDLMGGRVVRLLQGDFAQETVYSEDPVEIALRWESEGATWLHVVDLDGAFTGELQNLANIEAIARAASIPIQVGGGIRTRQAAHRLLSAGADRVVLGTAAVEEPEMVEALAQEMGDALVVSVDARNGLVAARGWTETSAITAVELVRRMASLGVRRFVYTDVGRDGTLTEPNFSAIEELVGGARVPIIASGGIATLEHLKRLKAIGVEGAIVGKALYEGRFSLREALGIL